VKSSEKIASLIGFALVLIAVALMWLINIWLGAVCTVIVAAALIWYRRTLKGGNTYLEDLADLMGCSYEGGELGFGRVSGVYRGREIEVAVNKDYDSSKGLAGFALSNLLMESTIGALAGITNYTSVKILHGGLVEEPYRLDQTSFVDRGLVLYLPPSGAEGIPRLAVDEVVARINELVDLADGLEGKG